LIFFTLVNSSTSFTDGSSVEPPFSTVSAVLLLFISSVMGNKGGGGTSPISAITSPAASMAAVFFITMVRAVVSGLEIVP
jgi:hypothetical protein